MAKQTYPIIPLAGFTKAAAVRNIVETMKKSDLSRDDDRSLILSLYDGDPPFSEEEQIKNNIETNVNFLEGPRVVHEARGQWNLNYMGMPSYFTVNIDLPDPVVRHKAEVSVNRHLKRITKQNPNYIENIRATGANVILFGVAPSIWPGRWDWVPEAVPISDVLVPGRTYMDMRNLGYFAVRRRWTPYELARKTMGRHVDPGWNKPLVESLFSMLMRRVHGGEGQSESNLDWDNPSDNQERLKENSLYYHSDIVPYITCWEFYDENPDTHEWHRCIIVDEEDELAHKKEVKEQFLYDGRRSYAKDWRQITHWQFGDLTHRAPAKYHTIRGMGFLMYSVLHLQNRLRCRLADKAFEELLTMIRSMTGAEGENINRLILYHLGIIPENVRFVTRDERYTPNEKLIVGVLSQNRQLMAESSSGFTPDIDSGTQKEMTATEAMSRMNTRQAHVNAVLSLSLIYEEFKCREIARRFCLPKSRNPDVQKFRKRVLMEGTPPEALDFERWEVHIERTMGGGNKQMQLMQANQLLQVRGSLDPSGQRIVLHRFILATTDDPSLADLLVPLDKKITPSSDHILGQHAAGALLRGVPVGIPDAVNRLEYVGGLMESLMAALQSVEQRGEPESMLEVIGLRKLVDHTAQNMALLSMDEANRNVVGKLQNGLAHADAIVKRLEQAMAAKMQQQGQDPEAQREQAAFLAEEQRKQTAFEADQARKNIELQANIGNQMHQARVDNAIADAETAAKLARPQPKPASPK